MRSRFQSIGLLIAVLLLMAFGLLALPSLASAQTPVVPGDKIGWDQPAATLAEASGLTYLVKIDTLAPVVVQPAAVVCTGTPPGPFACNTAFPAATPGVSHDVTVAARRVVVGPPIINVDSAFSTPLVFQLIVVPGTPVNIRRIAGDNE